MAITRIGLNQSINLASNITGTLATGNGGTGATSFAPGKTLQVVSAIRATEIATNSQSYQTTNCTASITPSASSSKVLVMITGSGREDAAGNTAKYTIFRDSTALGSNTANGFSEQSSDADLIKAPYSMIFLDSPSSTSSVAYTLFMKNQNGSGSCKACHNNTNTTVTLMEIAG